MNRNEEYAHEACLRGIKEYVIDHRPVGDFLTAVLSNKLKEAYLYADDYNTEHMWHLVKYLYHNVPAVCWGSEEAYKQWTARREKGDKNALDD